MWGRSPGLFSSEIHIQFLGNVCYIGLHHIVDQQFRLSMTSLEGEAVNAVTLDLIFDESSYAKYFHEIKGLEFHDPSKGKVPLLKSLKIVDSEFVAVIEGAVKEFEIFAQKE